MNHKYDEIINLPHHVSKTHPQMPMQDRAAQFAPFAALSGYDEAIRETGRLTEDKIEPGENCLNELNRKILWLCEHINECPEITFTYFQADARKTGGKYLRITGRIKKMDTFERTILLQNGAKLSLDSILDMDSEIFAQMEM